MSETSLTLNDRADCPNCHVAPVSTRSADGSETTACQQCGLAVMVSTGESYGPWNQLASCIAGASGTTE